MNFERLKPCPQQMQDRSQPIRANTEAQSIREEEHPNVPPGTVLQLIDEDTPARYQDGVS